MGGGGCLCVHVCGERGAAELRRVPGGAHEQEAANGIAHTQAADDDWRRGEERGGGGGALA